ncbi:MAG TPA: FAD-dependent oxidoreductase, partial [Nitrososphaerales archaeon]|nr:FAD-dependent oxidoreductase [Nitrososphaerales archaeon]
VTSRGVKFLGGHRALKITERGEQAETTVETSSERVLIRSRLVINAAGGGSLAIAHTCGLGVGLASLNFRGEYWVVDEPFASRVNSNIYRPPSFPQYPFLDPHFVVRADGSRQIGPNAVAVPDPYVYSGIGLSRFLGYLGRPLTPKGRLLASPDFIRLLAGEWRSSLSKNAMCDRVRRFVPGLGPGMLSRRAVFGVRSSVVDRNGFIPEATLLRGTTSMHILNFNSPGATGAPAFSALVVRRLRAEGMLEGLRVRNEAPAIPGWDFDPVAALVGTP